MHKRHQQALVTGLATFSMFFGVGNFIYPLVVGVLSQSCFFPAGIGLILSGVLVPFLGLFGMILFKGDHEKFLGRIGPRIGFLVATCIIALLGPFAAIPRCIIVSYGSMKRLFPALSLELFSIIFCIITFFFAWKRGRIIDLLGKFLTPILLTSLAVTIIYGIWYGDRPLPSSLSTSSSFFYGVLEGYHTMDLLATFFFSSAIITLLRQQKDAEETEQNSYYLKVTLQAFCIGAVLLGIVYFAFVYLAASFAPLLGGVPTEELLITISNISLGIWGSWIFALAAICASLTTVIALVLVSSDFLRKEVCSRKPPSHVTSISFILMISFAISMLRFNGIAMFLAPIMQIIYPALVVLAICNIAYKLFSFSWVKVPVFTTLLLSLVHYVYSRFFS